MKQSTVGCWQNSKNAWFTLYFRHSIVECNEAAAVVTKIAKLNAAPIPRSGKRSELHTQGSGKPYSATSCPVSLPLEALHFPTHLCWTWLWIIIFFYILLLATTTN